MIGTVKLVLIICALYSVRLCAQTKLSPMHSAKPEDIFAKSLFLDVLLLRKLKLMHKSEFGKGLTRFTYCVDSVAQKTPVGKFYIPFWNSLIPD